MSTFMGKDFLLENEEARVLFHEYASKEPIIDYHCHLSPKEIAEDKRYRSITEVWLGGDHYKWRAMRGLGVDEKYITGDAQDREKFRKWAECMPYIIGNPLYHWAHMELQRYFGIYEPLNAENADRVYDKCGEILKSDGFSARGLISRSNVESLSTTDDPVSDLKYHEAIAADKSFKTAVKPAFRPDKAVNISKAGFKEYIAELSEAAGVKIETIADVKTAISNRMDYFAAHGCALSDHGLDTFVWNDDEHTADDALRHALQGYKVPKDETDAYKTSMLKFCGEQYGRRGWVMQLHLSALRDNNTRMFRRLGPDTGYDSIYDGKIAVSVKNLLDSLDSKGVLPKTILYSLNPGDFETLISLATCYNESGIKGKMQLGSAWWFLDSRDGMRRQLSAFANIGVLSTFVGMLTDSRSFLSYARHEYFRRILCNLIGTWAHNGEVPPDMELLGNIVRDISYRNAREYFN